MKHIKLKEYIRKEITSILSETKLSESSNPDLERKIINLVRRCAKEYGIPMWDAFMAIEAKMAEIKRQIEVKYSLEEKILSENQMTTDEAFRILRDIEAVLPKRPSPSHIQLMGQALDHLQAGEITKMMDRERGLNETLEEKAWAKLDRLRDAIGDDDYIIQSLMRAMSTDDANLYLDAMIRDHIDIVDDAENYDNVSENDEEPTKADLKKKDSVASISNKLQKLVQNMKDKAKEYKAAEGEEKEKIKDELKKMTKEKKSLEKSI